MTHGKWGGVVLVAHLSLLMRWDRYVFWGAVIASQEVVSRMSRVFLDV